MATMGGCIIQSVDDWDVGAIGLGFSFELAEKWLYTAYACSVDLCEVIN